MNRVKNMGGFKYAAGIAALALLAGCGGQGADDPLLEGQRFGARVPLAESLPNEAGEFPVIQDIQEDRAAEITLPAAQSLTAWPQRGGNAQNLIPHAVLGSTLTEIWAVDIGQGNSRRARITADPVGADGRLFTLDGLGQVSAISVSGEVLWRVDLTAGFDRGGGISGGGLAVSGDQLFATTGYGELVALNVASGAVQWRQRLNAGLTTPTVSGNLVYVVGRDSSAWAVEASNGRLRWQFPGAPVGAILAGGAAPAIAERSVIFPFGSGELVAALRESGVRVWGTTVAGARSGVAYNNLNDITGDPVVTGGRVYAGNQSGRVVALNATSGERLWTAAEGAYSPVVPVGGSVFFISDRNELLRIDAETGARIWGTELPLFVANRVARRDAIFTHYGPILTNGALLMASGDGQIRFFDPVNGRQTGSVGIRGGAAANPIVMGDTLYVISGAGRLHAYR
ncbi:MAG: PQQ-binding-like beta-propeller repeat protein [Pseudomonadota bacterium]